MALSNAIPPQAAVTRLSVNDDGAQATVAVFGELPQPDDARVEEKLADIRIASDQVEGALAVLGALFGAVAISKEPAFHG
jgi:hypothetical protein